MTFTDLALKAVLIYIGAIPVCWISAMYAADEFAKVHPGPQDELRIQLSKQRVARRASVRVAALPVAMWFIWVCVRAANLAPD